MLTFLKKRWYLVLIVLGIVGFMLFQARKGAAPLKTQKEFKVRRDTIKDVLSLSGKVDADEKTTLRFQSSGRLAWVGVKEGQEVKKYQAIASLDQRDLQNKMKQYLNTFLGQRWNLDQSREDNNNNLGSQIPEIKNKAQRLIDQQQFDVDNAVLTVELQQLALDYANLWTPIDGIVTRVASPKAGVNITPSQAEFDIVNPKTIYFSALADQTDVVKIKESMNGDILLDAFPDQKIPGTVTSIAYVPKDGETGTVYAIKVSLYQPGVNYRLGMTGDVEFTLREKKEVIVVPSTYIKRDKDLTYVNILKNGSIVKQFITTGDASDTMTEIKSGLAVGDKIYD